MSPGTSRLFGKRSQPSSDRKMRSLCNSSLTLCAQNRSLVGACCAFLFLIPDPHLIQGSTDGVMEGGPDLADELVLAVGPSAVGEQDHGNSTI